MRIDPTPPAPSSASSGRLHLLGPNGIRIASTTRPQAAPDRADGITQSPPSTAFGYRVARVRHSEVRDGTLFLPARADGYLNLAPTDHLHVRHVTPPDEWMTVLRDVSPKSDDHGFLELVWEAGDAWITGHRWTLYEMLHERFIDDEILSELQGPHPRSEGHMCSTKVPGQFQCLCRRKLESWRGGPCQLITTTQWELYRRTGYFGRPFWIIQGERGGHKFTFTESEKEMWRRAATPGDPPALGELSYAPFDGRVVRQIERHNRLKSLGVTLGEFKRLMGSQYDQHKARLAKELRTEYVKWFDESLLDVNDAFIHAARKGDMDDERKTSVDWDHVDDVATGHYLETGELLSPSQIK
jgi:hypothetical protein